MLKLKTFFQGDGDEHETAAQNSKKDDVMAQHTAKDGRYMVSSRDFSSLRRHDDVIGGEVISERVQYSLQAVQVSFPHFVIFLSRSKQRNCNSDLHFQANITKTEACAMVRVW